jgi:peptide/nickel transport system substrate-binding protein
MEGSSTVAPAAGKRGVSKKLVAIIVVAVLLVAAVGAAILLSSGAAKSNYDANVFKYGSISGNYEHLDPAKDYETVGGEILQNVYETLVFYNGSSASELKPMLATEVPTVANGGISADGLTYIFNIRQGVKFSDGTALTAADVKYSFDRALMLNDPQGPFWMYGQSLIPNYYNSTIYPASTFAANGNIVPSINQTVLDQHIWVNGTQVQFNLTAPYPAFLAALAFNGGSIVSQTFVEAHGGLTKAGYDYMDANTMGTGPYKVAEIKVDSYVKLVRNDNYWRTPAKIETILISQVADTNARIMALKNGDLDAAAIPRAQRASVEGAPNITVVKGNPTFNIDFLGLNQKLNLTGADATKTNVPADFFADKNVRLAFAYAFNYGLYMNETLQGMAIVPNGAIPQGMFGYDASVPAYSYDLAMAKSYLENATHGSSNWLADGFNLEVFYNAGNDARETACLLMQSGLEALNSNIHVTVTPLEWSVYLEYRTTGKMPAMFLGWAPDYADPDDYVQPFYLSSGTYASMVNYANTTLDDKIAAAAAELNTTVRAEMYKNISMDMQKECVFIWTSQATNFFVGHDYIQGYYFNPMYSNLYYYDLSKSASP